MLKTRRYEKSDAAAVNAIAIDAFEQYASIYRDWNRLKEGLGSMSSWTWWNAIEHGKPLESSTVPLERGLAEHGRRVECHGFG